MKKLVILAGIYGLLNTAAVSAEIPWTERLDAVIEQAKAKTNMAAGTAYLVVRGDQILHEGYFGYADVENRIKVDPETNFYIASTTKAYFSLATLLAEHRDDLKETTTLAELFPDATFEGFNAKTITVRNLLTHTHGLENKHMTWAGSYTGLHDSELRRKMLLATQDNPDVALGEFDYSNLGYNILSIWFEDRYGKDWRDTMRETLLAPLGMQKTSGYMSDTEKNGWQMTKPYTYKVGDGQTSIYLQKDDKTMFAIGLVSTPRDVAKLLIAELNQGRLGSEQVLPANVIRKSQVKQVEADPSYFDGYAWGWLTGTKAGKRVNFHTGGFVGASALISYMPDEDVGLVVLHNEGGLRANYLSGIIEDAVYGSLVRGGEFELSLCVDAEINDMVTAYERAKSHLSAQRQKLEQTAWQLTHAPNKYVGRYSHPLSGDIVVSHTPSGEWNFEWGNLHGRAYPDGVDTVLAELRPGSFDNFNFVVAADDVQHLQFGDFLFTKLN